MWKLDLSQLKQIKLKDYIVRFLFGGAVSVVAALISALTNDRIGGIFTAFPAILLASLTIINRIDGKHDAERDARGAIRDCAQPDAPGAGGRIGTRAGSNRLAAVRYWALRLELPLWLVARK